MQQRIILPGEVGSTIEPRLTVDGLRDMIQDMRRNGERIPTIILVSEYERRDLNQDLLAGSVHEVAKEDRRPEHDGAAIGIVEGVMIRSHPDVSRGKARLIYPPVVDQNRPGTGKIIVGPN
jgi:hypothetical protein